MSYQDDNMSNMEGRTIELGGGERLMSYREEMVRTQSVRGEDGFSINNSTIATEDVGHDVSRLYTICEMAMPRPEDATREVTKKELEKRKEMLAQTWESIREWLAAHPSMQERSQAGMHQGQFLTTALHMVCKLADPPADIVQSLIDCAPETVTWPDSNGWLPLHHACANGASGKVLSVLVNAYPEGKVTQDKRLRTPLHFAFFRTEATEDQNQDDDDDNEIGNSMPEIVNLLSDSGAAELQDEGGMLPMHYASAYGTSTEVLEVLVDAFPDSVVATENKGRTPLHLAMVNAHRNASPKVVDFLLRIRRNDIINVYDKEGHLPLHLLAMASKFPPERLDARQNAIECLRMYLDAKPKATADFLTAIQALPEWLRDRAVVSQHVQDILNHKIAKRFPTMILLLDAYFLIILIVCFEIASNEAIDERFTSEDPGRIDSLGTLYAIFFGGSYFLGRELIQMISLISLGTFSSWLWDMTNWLDMTLIFCVFYFGALMADNNRGDNEMFRSGVAMTKGVLWCSVISFLKSTLVDFAVFVGGVIYVIRRLAAFLLALGVILLAFAQMFLIVYSETGICACNDDPEITADTNFPHCDFKDSLLKVYTMLMGEIGNEMRYSTSRVAQFLYVAFAFLVVILLSNVLIAIVTDSYGVIKNERAAMVFWSNRLDFVAEMDAIKSVGVKVRDFFDFLPFVKSGKSRVPGAPMRVQETPEGAGQDLDRFDDEEQVKEKEPFRSAWKNLMSLFDPNLYENFDVNPGSFEFWCYFFFRIVAITIIIPLWLVAGVATAGWLWPPQVREYLFVQSKAAISRADMAEQVSNQINLLKEQIRSLRTELKGEMKSDRREFVSIKAEVETVQAEVMADLLQVKEIMTTLLEMSRNR